MPAQEQLVPDHSVRPAFLTHSTFSDEKNSPKKGQEGRANSAYGEVLREVEARERYHNRVQAKTLHALGVRGFPKPTLLKSAKYFEILVSAAGLEPATHALKGHCSTN